MCKRSEATFPTSCNDAIGYIKKAWCNGWLDDYSNEHFLIKSINNQLTEIEWESQLLFNNSNSFNTPIKMDGKVDYNAFSQNFIINLSSKLMRMSAVFGEEKIKKFIKNQLSAGKSSYDRDMFFQALSEIEILSFYCGRIKWTEALYEPPVGATGSNPEARFIIRDSHTNTYSTVNIEVKTPKFPIIVRNRERKTIPTILLTDLGRRKIHKLCQDNKSTCIMPRVTKLVQFINSAAKKFEKPQANEYNLLYINWSYSDFPSNGFLEAWSLLTNEKNGILTHPEIGTKLPFDKPICNEAYEKITAVIVYTSSLEQLMFSDFRYSWQASPNAGPRFRMFVLNKELREKELADESNILLKLTGMNPSILEPKKWRVLFDHNWIDETTIESKSMDVKFSVDALNIVNENFLIL